MPKKEPKKKPKNKCAGCVWGKKICEHKVLCLFPYCVKEHGHVKPDNETSNH
jgi:hypothetical protein